MLSAEARTMFREVVSSPLFAVVYGENTEAFAEVPGATPADIGSVAMLETLDVLDGALAAFEKVYGEPEADEADEDFVPDENENFKAFVESLRNSLPSATVVIIEDDEELGEE